MILVNNQIFKNRKEAKEALGSWQYKKAARANKITIINDDSVLYGRAICTNTENSDKK